MKKILLFPILFILLGSIITLGADSQKKNVQEMIISLLNDSADTTLNPDTEYLLFTFGNEGWCRSLIVHNDSSFRLFSPNNYPGPKIVLVDTAQFIKDNKKTISWAFDSLAAALIKSPKEKVENPLMLHSLTLAYGDSVIVHKDQDSMFVGPNRSELYQNFGRIFYLMLWLSSTEMRISMPQPYDDDPRYLKKKKKSYMKIEKPKN